MLPRRSKVEHTRPASLSVDTNVPIHMRDGTILRAEVYRPSGPGPWPVLLSRIPYGKHNPRYRTLHLDLVRAAARGYVMVVQDVRGRHASDGEWYPFRYDGQDGYDTVEWCASQPWSDGNVGMFGMSYHGASQWLAAVEAPPSLKAIAPGLTSADLFDSWTYLGGAFGLWWTGHWSAGFVLDNIKDTPDNLTDAVAETRKWAREPLAFASHLPVRDMPGLRKVADYYYDWMDHPTYDDYWKKIGAWDRLSNVNVPVLSIGGYFDSFIRGTVRSYRWLREHGATPATRDQQHMVLGPWIHSHLLPPNAGQRYFGGGASGPGIDYQGMVLAWYDHWLKGEDNGVDSDPHVYYFTMGDNNWQEADSWPPPSVETPFFLRSNGRANSRNGDGSLSLDPPRESELPDSYLHNPLNPVPTVGGPYVRGIPGFVDAGSIEQTPAETREDVLVYTSAPVESRLEVTGQVSFVLWAATSARDTDWAVTVSVVEPNGASYNFCEGILRASYRDSLESPSPIKPDQVYEYTIDLGPTSIAFQPGQSIRLRIASSNFPAFARNLGTGGPVNKESRGNAVVALQTVLHDAAHPSRLVLPIVES